MEKELSSLPKLLTPKDLKEYFKQNGMGIGNDKLYALLKRKDFPSFKIGNSYYIIENEFIGWMENQTKKLK